MALSRAPHLSRAFSDEALWQWPNDTTEPIYGKLTYTPSNGLKLTIPDCPDHHPLHCRWFDNSPVVDKVIGTSIRSHCNWLLTRLLPLQRAPWPRRATIVYFSHIGYRFARFSQPCTAMVKAVEIVPSHLRGWPFSGTHNWSSLIDEAPMTPIVTPFPSLISRPDDSQFAVRTEVLPKQGTDGNVVIRAQQVVSRTLSRPAPLDCISGHVNELRNFVSLFAGGSATLRSVRFRVSVPDGDSASSPIGSAFYSQAHPGRANGRYPHYLPAGWFVENFDPIVKRWQSLMRELRSLLEHFFALIHSKQTFSDDRFLAMAFLLEALHRHTVPGEFMPTEEFVRHLDAMKAAIPSDAPADWRISVSARLQYSNERSLRVRLRELFRALPTNVAAVISDRTASDWSDQICALRNDLVHTPTLEDKGERIGIRYVELAAQMELVFWVHILRRMEMPPELIPGYLPAFEAHSRIRLPV